MDVLRKRCKSIDAHKNEPDKPLIAFYQKLNGFRTTGDLNSFVIRA